MRRRSRSAWISSGAVVVVVVVVVPPTVLERDRLPDRLLGLDLLAMRDGDWAPAEEDRVGVLDEDRLPGAERLPRLPVPALVWMLPGTPPLCRSIDAEAEAAAAPFGGE